MRLKKLLSFGLISILLATSLPFTGAQENIQLILMFPEWMSDSFNEDLLDDFEAAHPGVEVVLKEGGQETSYITPPAYDLEQFLTAVEATTISADVFLVNDISPAATQANFLLNLEPLVRADTSLNPDDFYPAIWRAYQWDGGIWALPFSVNIEFLVYTPERFDEAGLSYPTGSWTIEDYATAAEALAERDANGEVTMPGLLSWNAEAMLRAFLGRGFFDDTQFPAVPSFTFPELEPLMTRWKELMDSGIVGYPSNGMGPDVEFGMAIGGAWYVEDWQGVTGRQPVLLPGNTAIANVQGFAVSAGTQYPELAYELAKYLTNDPGIALRTGGTPARQSLADAEMPENMGFFQPEYTPELQAFLDEAITNALTPADLRFREYVGRPFYPAPDEEPVTDIALALQDAEAQAKSDIQAAIERRNAITLVVTPPEALPELAPGEVGLNFGLFLNISPMPNREVWDAFAQEFAANDPEVGYVLIDPSFGGMEHPATQYDCFYADRWYAEGNPEENLVSLDPFMSADPSFDRNDFLAGTLESVQDEAGQTWAFPILVLPRVLSYNTVQFDNAGLPYPAADWTVSDFIETLQALHANSGEKALVNWDWGTSYIFMLIAAYGGVPFDPSAEEVAVNLTDPTNMEAVRQVLDLAKEGLIDYQELATMGGGGGGGGGIDGPPLVARFVSDIDWGFGGDPANAEFEDPYRYINYPRGSNYIPVSYDVKSAYISNQTPAPEACYRFISALSQRPELFSGMPARRSTIDLITDSRADLFHEYVAILESPSAVLINPQAVSTESYVAGYLVGRAFDRYVLEDADLQLELENAQTMVNDIVTCMNNLSLPELEPATATEEEWQAQFEQQRDCALSVDPSLSELFPSFE